MKRITIAFMFLWGTTFAAMTRGESLRTDVHNPTANGQIVDVRSFDNLSTAKASRLTAGKTILITNEQKCNNLSIPPDREIAVASGGSIDVSRGNTLKIHKFYAGINQHVFTGAGVVDFGGGAVKEVYPQWWGIRADGMFDDGPAIQKALDTGMHVHLPRTERPYNVLTSITMSAPNQTLSGDGYTFLTTPNDIEIIRVTGAWQCVTGMDFSSTCATETKRHIQCCKAYHPVISNCTFHGDARSPSGAGVGFGDGLGGVGGSMGLVDNCVFDHGSIEVRTWDVKIQDSWVWANQKAYGIAILGGVGNTTIVNVDVLPPVRHVAGAKAGIWMSGPATQPVIIGCYIDGGPLDTGVGILAENGVLGLKILGLRANQCKSDVVVLDSVLNATIVASTFMNNNVTGLGAVDIRLKSTFEQQIVNTVISDSTFQQTSTVPRNPAAAIKIEHGAAATIHHCKIQQPGTGGGYSDQEIESDDGGNSVDLHGTSGTRKMASCAGSVLALAGSTYAVATCNFNLYFPPRMDQVRVSAEGEPVVFSLRPAQEGYGARLLGGSSFIPGHRYEIESRTNLDFITHGALNNNKGTQFTALDSAPLGVGDSVKEVKLGSGSFIIDFPPLKSNTRYHYSVQL